MFNKQIFSTFTKRNPLFKIQKRNFSMFNSKPTSTSRTLGYGLLGLGASGLGYLMYHNSKANANYQKQLISSQVSMKSEIVNQRTRDTLVYFCGGLGLTSVSAFALSKFPKMLQLSSAGMSALITLPVMFLLIHKIRTTPISDSTKPLYFVAFNTMIAFSLCPLAAYAPVSVLRDAALLTGGTFAGLGAVAVTSKDDAFLGLSGILGAGLGGLCAISIANIFMQSTMIHNIWLYGGLGLFLAFTLYDIKEIQIKAKKEQRFDPMWNSLSIYLDFINIFVRLVSILGNRKK